MANDSQTDEDFSSLVCPQILSPLRYAKVLIQLGYEPLAPTLGHSLLSIIALSKPLPRYPWIGAYLYHMYNKRGLYHLLTTGFAARFTADVLCGAAEKATFANISEFVKSSDKESEDIVEECSWTEFRHVLLRLSVSKIFSIVIVFPFKVIMTRQMADFIADDTNNEWFHNAAICIYKENGLLGFYKGLIPSLIGEVSKCTLYYLFCRILKKALKPSRTLQYISGEGQVDARRDKTLQFIFRSITRYLCSNLFYPCEVVSTVMMMDKVRLSNGTLLSEFNSWRVCWRMLKAENQLYRGYSFMFRSHVKRP